MIGLDVGTILALKTLGVILIGLFLYIGFELTKEKEVRKDG